MSDKKVMQFIDSTFPPYNKCTVLETTSDKTIAILDYGKSDKLKVTIGYFDGDYSMCRLLQTDFI